MPHSDPCERTAAVVRRANQVFQHRTDSADACRPYISAGQAQQAAQDPVTALLNRHGLMPLLEQHTPRGKAPEQSGVLLPVDLDRSKAAHQACGPALCDGHLAAEARAIRSLVGKGGLAARINVPIHAATAAAAGWAVRIRWALEKGGFIVHYQPIVRLRDSRVNRWEALLRLKDPQEGLLAPSQFLPHALRLGLMPSLDLWVTRSVLLQLGRDAGLRACVNLSVQTLQDGCALRHIQQAVIEVRPKPGQLMFEISEAATVGDLARVSQWVRGMKRLGCRFALDDFGTGASSFEHLRSLDVDMVKIDGSYVREIAADPACLAFVQEVTSMCRTAGVEVVAEGIESPGVIPILARAGIRLGQGYLLGRPAPLAAFRLPPAAGCAEKSGAHS